MTIGLLYLSGPLSAGHGRTVEDNVRAALDVYYRCVRAGIPTFCPHLAALDPAAFDLDYELWMQQDLAILRRCTHVLMLPNWQESPGAIREHDFMQSLQGDFFGPFPDITNIFYRIEDVLP